jgi:hypothetical protein
MGMTLNKADVDRALAGLGSKIIPVIRRSLKRAAVAGRQAIVKDLSDDTGLPTSKARAAVVVNVVSDKQVNLEVSGARIPLIQFGARGPEPSRGKGRGVSYRNPGGSSRGRLPHGFIATLSSGHRGVFERTGRFTTRPSKRKGGKPVRRETIAEKFGPSLVHVFRKYVPVAQERALEALATSLKTEIDFALKR